MDAESNEMLLVQHAMNTSTQTSISAESHNLKIRRQNIPESVDFPIKENNVINRRNCVPLVILSKSIKAWDSDRMPRLILSGEQNLILNHENDCDSNDNDSDIVDSLTNNEKVKLTTIRNTIANPNPNLRELRLLGCSTEGFVNDEIRRDLWLKLLGLVQEELIHVNGLETIHTHLPNEIYQQILKDVARSGSHISQNATDKETEIFHQQLTQLMCWVLHKHSKLNYYQGYNDVAATVLLVMGLQAGLYVLESISLQFMERFMEKTMEKVNQELFYIFALLERVHPTLLEHLENVELFPHFALAEYTTWYAHKFAENRKLLHRLFDYFLGSPTLMPLYLSTVIVAHRAAEIFSTTPDMGHTHKVLCTLSDDLPFETLLIEATNLYQHYPPESISNDVKNYDCKRRIKEQEWKAKAEANRLERERQRKLKIVQATPRISYRIKNYKTITVVTILAIGLYAFLKSSTGLN